MMSWDSKRKMYDIHMHLIPDVDDGSWTLDMSRRMMELADIHGIQKIIATPHSSALEWSAEEVKEQYDLLCQMAEHFFPYMKIYMGTEIMCNRFTVKKNVCLLEEGTFKPLNGTKYVLVEFCSSACAEEIIECTEYIIENGWIPVVAHVERYTDLFNTKDSVEILKKMGCMFQVNMYSVLEEENAEIKNNAKIALEQKYIDFVGSDAHKIYDRPPCVNKDIDYLYDNYDEEYINEILYVNAEKYLLL